MPPRVGSMQQQDDDETALERLSARVKAAREAAKEKVSGSDGPDGIDARTVGTDRDAVNARDVDISAEQAAAAGRGAFGDDIPTADGSEARSRVAKARARAANKVRTTVNEQKAALRAEAQDTSAKDLLKRVASAAAASGQTGNRQPGATGTQSTEIAERATDAAQVRAPMGGSLRTVGDERVVEAMARSGGAMGEGLLMGAPAEEQGDSPDDGIVGFGVSGDMALVDAGFGDDSPGVGLSFDDPLGVTGGVGDDDSELSSNDADLLVGFGSSDSNASGGLL